MKIHRAGLAAALLSGALAAPAPAQFVVQNHANLLAIDDGEITPDGRYGVVAENDTFGSAHVFDMASGALLATVGQTVQGITAGTLQDAVAVTDQRAVVLAGSTLILDLGNLATAPLLAEHHTGAHPRDLAVTPDGSLVAVRGGEDVAGGSGGLFVFDLASGALLLQAPGAPTNPASPTNSFDVDSVVATDRHAVFLSRAGNAAAPRARVTIVDLHPAGGGPPQVVYETGGADPDQPGAPHDLALTLDGAHVAVRSELGVGLYRLAPASVGRAWERRLFGDPGPFGGSALDSIEATADRVATISRYSTSGLGAQVDVFDLAGNQRHHRLLGDPHDLALVPGTQQVAVRTSSLLALYDMAQLPPGDELPPTDLEPLPSTHASYFAGLDSVVASATGVFTLARQGNAADVRLWRIEGGDLVLRAQHTLPDLPIDLDLAPSGEWLAVVGFSYLQVYDVLTTELAFEHDPSNFGWWPWADGVALDDERVLAFGYQDINLFGFGWVTIVDLFQQPQEYCTAAPNSVGPGAELHATGSASVAANDLILWASGMPPTSLAVFAYAQTTAAMPFGDGVLCLGSPLVRFPSGGTGLAGIAGQPVDYTGAPFQGGLITAGSTWHFQVFYRDPGSSGAKVNLSHGLTIDFLP